MVENSDICKIKKKKIICYIVNESMGENDCCRMCWVEFFQWGGHVTGKYFIHQITFFVFFLF